MSVQISSRFALTHRNKWCQFKKQMVSVQISRNKWRNKWCQFKFLETNGETNGVSSNFQPVRTNSLWETELTPIPPDTNSANSALGNRTDTNSARHQFRPDTNSARHQFRPTPIPPSAVRSCRTPSTGTTATSLCNRGFRPGNGPTRLSLLTASTWSIQTCRTSPISKRTSQPLRPAELFVRA